jgi:hypothetical protein
MLMFCGRIKEPTTLTGTAEGILVRWVYAPQVQGTCDSLLFSSFLPLKIAQHLAF